MRKLLIFVSLLCGSAGAVKVGVFDIHQYKDSLGSPVTMVSAPNIDKEEKSTIVFACSRDGFEVYYDTGGYPFSANLDSIATAYKFSAYGVSNTRDWNMGTSHASIFAPEDLKLSFFRQALKSTQLTTEIVVGPQYGLSNTDKFNFKGFSAVAMKYLKCVK